jgi:ABC-type glycerol-3-phosphate transport system permease component
VVAGIITDDIVLDEAGPRPSSQLRAHHRRQAGVSYSKGGRIVLHVFLIVVALVWLVPIVAAIYSSFRFFESDTNVNGVFSLPETLTLDNYRRAWSVGRWATTSRRPPSS